MKLELFSEPFPPSGAFSGNGASKLLGTPRNNRFETLVREAVQNCWDAKSDGRTSITVQLRLRTVSGEHGAQFRKLLKDSLPPAQSAASYEMFGDILSAKGIRVLEIADFGTDGLAGSTRSDRPRAKGEKSDFVDFMRDIGAPRDKDQGGGTYGYGKSSFYHASRCSTIFVDTLTTEADAPVRRVMGCHIGNSYSVPDGELLGRYTGRHWWGVMDEGVIEPLTGEDAREFSQVMGFAERKDGQTGTSILIIDPVIPGEADEDAELAGALIREILLWNFWPKMMVDASGSPQIAFFCEIEGRPVEIPDPLHCPPMNVFADALAAVRAGDGAPVHTRTRDRTEIGSIKASRLLSEQRSPLLRRQGSLVPDQLAHIAVMRPVELVVRYYTFPKGATKGIDSAGVFVSSNDPEVEAAFVSSEPPAHDDWIPDALPKASRAKRIVAHAIDAVKEAGNEWARISVRPGTSPDDRFESAARRIAELLPASPESNKPGGRKRSGTLRAAPRKQKAWFEAAPVGLQESSKPGEVLAEFTLTLDDSDGVYPIVLRAEPRIVREGKPDRSDEGHLTPGGQRPVIRSWTGEDGKRVSKQARVKIRWPGTYRVQVALPEPVAIVLDVIPGAS
ncbi:MAG: hypothetical protein ACRBEQ_07230 [Hyphomonas sp.]